MSQLNDNLTEILSQKNTYLISQNLRKNVTCLGITGTLEEGIDTSDANATANDILLNKTAYVNGSKIIGSHVDTQINNQNKTVTPTTSQQVVLADQGYTGLGDVTVNAVTSSIDKNIVAGNIKKGIQILGVTGTYEGEETKTYIELEYIESTGTQCVDTDIYPTNINKIDIAAMFTAETDSSLFGCRASASGDTLAIGINYSNTETRNMIQYGYGKRGWTRISTSYIPVNTYFTLSYEFVIDGSSGKISWNNSYENVYDNSGSGLSELSNVSIYLFGYNMPYRQPGYMCGESRIYNCKMYGYSGSLVRDFIPVKRKSDNEICLYDKVTNTFFTNQGTGSFVAGPVKEAE